MRGCILCPSVKHRHITSHSLMTTSHKLLASIVHEYVVKNDDLDGFVDDFLIYFPDTDEDILSDWVNGIQSTNE